MFLQIKENLRKNGICYILTVLIIMVLDIIYRSSDTSSFTWILAPTARWAGILGGMYFEPMPGEGYVNETFRFLIAPSCSGIRFLQIVLLLLIFSYTHRIGAGRRKALWMPACCLFSYCFTVLVNGIRIVLSIYIPLLTENASLHILTPRLLHNLIGVTVYFSALLALHALTDKLFCGQYGNPAAGTNIIPTLWYLLAVLGLPFVKRLATGKAAGFGGYALPIVLSCCVVLLLSHIFKCRKGTASRPPKSPF